MGYPFPLHEAVEDNCLDLVQSLLNAGEDINKLDKFGRTSLHLAVRFNRESIVNLLLAQGADINAQTKKSNTPLHMAIKKENIKLAALLIKTGGCDVNIVDKNEDTPLHLAVSYGLEAILDLLLEANADLNIRNYRGRTPLFTAVDQERITVIEKLLDKGADIESVEGDFGKTPLIHAFSHASGFKVINLLLEKGAKVNAQDFKGKSALHFVGSWTSLSKFKLLLDKGADINLENKNGLTPLFEAVVQADKPAVHFLLERGAEVNVKDRKGKTPLRLAIESKNIKLAELLLSYGTEIESATHKGWSPLRLLYVPRSLRFNSDDCKTMLKEYIIKMRAVNLKLHLPKRFDKRIDFSDCQYFQAACSEEVSEMKKKRFGGINLYDVFSKRSDPSFSDNSDLIQFVQSDNLENDFPMFAGLLRTYLRRAEVRNQLMKFTDFNLKANSGNMFMELPNEIKRNIMSYLTNKDIEHLMESFEVEI